MRKKEKEEVIVKRYGRGILIGYAALCLAAAVLGAVMLWMSEWSFDSWYYVCCVAVGAGGFLWTVARIVRHSRTPKNLVVLRGSVLCAFTDAGRQEFRPEEIQFVDEDPIRKRSRTYDKGELDISLKDGRHIEIKYAERERFEEACQSALKQIEEKNYTDYLREDNFHTIYRYGIACYKKKCRVQVEKEKEI